MIYRFHMTILKSLRPLTMSLMCLLYLSLAGCVTLPSASDYNELQLPESSLSEELLLDVGVVLFDPAIERLSADELENGYQQIRLAEARYMPVVLAQTLSHTEQWGYVHLLSEASMNIDVLVQARILESTSHTLRLAVTVADASGRIWFETTYTENVGEQIYSPDALGVNDPFQGLYNRIANDMLNFARTELDSTSITNLRHLASLDFAAEFAGDAFAHHSSIDEDGIRRLSSLPAEDDPLYQHTLDIRERDGLFHDTMGRYYTGFARQIAEPYYYWRRDHYREMRSLQESQASGLRQVAGGVLLIGLATATGDTSDLLSSTASAISAVSGSRMMSRGLTQLESTSYNFLDELSESFAGDVSTQVIELDERTVVLSGSVNEIYGEWQKILEDMYQREMNERQ